jgi:threonine-phosphate decarboxylase
VKREEVFCGAGASDVLFRLCLAYKPKRVAVIAPTFSEYERSAVAAANATIIRYTLNASDNFRLTDDFLSFLADFTREAQGEHSILFLCNPNNPTGQLIDPKLLRAIDKICAREKVLLVMDECFLPFTTQKSIASRLRPGLVVIGAFTKTYALAGLRLGYMLCSDAALLEACGNAGPFWNVSFLAQAAGVAALRLPGWAAYVRDEIDTERPYLEQELTSLGLDVCPSSANFILFRAPGITNLVERLKPKGILVRWCGNFEGLNADYYRVCVKMRNHNEYLLKSMKEALGG